jgi:hypothetical protein
MNSNKAMIGIAQYITNTTPFNIDLEGLSNSLMACQA